MEIYLIGAIVFFGLAISGWLLWRRYSPLALTIPEKPLSSGGRQFGANIDSDPSLGAVGELITSLMHANEGWRQLPSQPSGVHGLDGIFVRTAGIGLFDVRIVETKCSRDNEPRHDENQMSDEGVVKRLERLREKTFEGQPYLSAKSIDNLVAAINRGSARVTKWFYAHTLSTGVTRIHAVKQDGKLSKPALKSISDARHKLMFQVLAIGLSRLHARDENFVVQGGAAMSAEPKAVNAQ